MNSYFGTDGIRGQANRHPVTPEIALQLGKAIAHVFGATGHGSKRIIIGKDTRLSGYMLETALTSGLVSMGMDVLLVGPVPTPAVAHLTRSMAATAGIMLTASHNPFDDNGIKIFDSDGFKLSDDIEDEIADLLQNSKLNSEHIRSTDLGKAFRIEDARGRYIEFAKSAIGNIRLDGLKMVLDCANGAAYLIGPWIFKELGAGVIKSYAEPDGFNINNSCGALHPDSVAQKVQENGADLGIAFDGDADRVVFVDAQGKVVDGDHILAMCALDLQRHGLLQKNTLVVTSMSNLGLHEAMRERGIKVEVTDVGDRYVIDSMRKNGFNLGGENSGHVIFSDYASTGDGIITALQVLRMMKESGKTLSELANCMKLYPQEVISLPVKEKVPLESLKNLQLVLQKAKTTLCSQGRVIVRYSGTEKKVRLLVEAQQAQLVTTWQNSLVDALERDAAISK